MINQLLFNKCRFSGFSIFNLIIFIPLQLFGAFDHYPADPANIGRGLMVLDPAVSSIGIIHDPSALAGVRQFSGTAMWGNRFGLKDLTHGGTGTSFPFRSFGIGIGLSSFGNSLYQESISFISVGRNVTERLKMGFSLVGYGLSIRNYGSALAMGINFSWRINFNRQMSWGGALRNINSPSIGKVEDLLPQVVVTGFSFQLEKRIMTQIEWDQDTEYSGRLKFGAGFDIWPWIRLSGGFISNPGQGTGGIAIHAGKWTIHYGAVTHPELGWSQWLGVGFRAL